MHKHNRKNAMDESFEIIHRRVYPSQEAPDDVVQSDDSYYLLFGKTAPDPTPPVPEGDRQQPATARSHPSP